MEEQTIDLPDEVQRHLLIRNILENTPLRITNRERMLTKQEYLRSEVLTAVLLTIQVFWDMTPYH